MTSCQQSIGDGFQCRPTRAADGAHPGGFLARVYTWHERALRRHELGELLEKPDHLLKDMGIHREDVYREYRKPFWRA